jgi:hypothetical protein
MTDKIIVGSRYCGPPDSGNGGYVCGLLGSRFPGTAQVTLRLPPPLDRELLVSGDLESALKLTDGERLVAEASAAGLELDVPALPPAEAVAEAARHYKGFHQHMFPGCFVCGPQRRQGDGLRIFAGGLDGGRLVAAPWIPDSSLADAAGFVRPEFVWASLDCPGYFAVEENMQPMLLGRLTLELEGQLQVGEACTVLAWPLGSEGRKNFAGTALFDAGGRRIARARAVWVTLRA